LEVHPLPYNGSGVFARVYSWVTDAANGVNVSSSRTDTDSNDIATGLSNCITKDGQQTVTANIPLAGFKLTGIGLGTGATDAANVSNANILAMCEFRLTLTTVTPVTTADVTAATTVFVTPYRGNRIALYDATNWHMRSSAEMSIAVPATTSTIYDLFCYDNSTVPTLEALAWTNDTTRATALVLQNGVLCKSGDTTRRYLGSFRTTTVSGQTEDSFAKRFIWNYYNRVRRPMRVTDATASWTYTTATLRQANNSTANQLDFIIGVSEDVVEARLQSTAASSTISTTQMGVVIGLDTTSGAATGCYASQGAPAVANTPFGLSATYRGFPGVGRHFLAWQEIGNGSATNTFFSNQIASGLASSGIQGEILG
jgi:hypothetical protein